MLNLLNRNKFNSLSKKDREEEYFNLYNELIDGTIRDNDEFRILQYECAIRHCKEELNRVIKYNGYNINSLKDKSLLNDIKKIEKSGLSICYSNNIGPDIEFEYIELGCFYLDYNFLEDIPEGRFDTTEDIPHATRKNLHISSLNKTLYVRKANTKKDFIKLFGKILENKTLDQKQNGAGKVVDMFYMYDQFTYYGVKIDNIVSIFKTKYDKRTKKVRINTITKLCNDYLHYR